MPGWRLWKLIFDISRPMLVARNFGFVTGFMKSRVCQRLGAYQFQGSLLTPRWCSWTLGWRRWKLIFEIFWQILVAMRWTTCGPAFDQRKKPFLHASARKPWLTVYRARSGIGEWYLHMDFSISKSCEFKKRLPYSDGKFCADHFGPNSFSRGRIEKKTSGPFGVIFDMEMSIFKISTEFGSCLWVQIALNVALLNLVVLITFLRGGAFRFRGVRGKYRPMIPSYGFFNVKKLSI